MVVVQLRRGAFTYHSDPLKGEDGRPKKQRVVFGPPDFGQVDGVCDVLGRRGAEVLSDIMTDVVLYA